MCFNISSLEISPGINCQVLCVQAVVNKYYVCIYIYHIGAQKL